LEAKNGHEECDRWLSRRDCERSGAFLGDPGRRYSPGSKAPPPSRFLPALTIIALSVAGFAAVQALTGANEGQVVPGSSVAPTLTPSTIVLDPPLDTETFAPPGDAQPQLTALEAIAVFQAVDSEFQLPDDATNQLGYYTAALGDGSYRYENRLAWGFTWHECAQPQHEVSPGTVMPCTRWLFLDANTGEMLELVWQRDS
jgi:hypothetical protein